MLERKFSTNPTVAVRFIFNPSSTAALKEDRVATAPNKYQFFNVRISFLPDLSIYIVSIYPVGFIFKPPASKHTPFPISATSISELFEGLPR